MEGGRWESKLRGKSVNVWVSVYEYELYKIE